MPFLLVWAGLFALDLAFGLALPESALRTAHLPVGMRLTLACSDGLALAVFVAVAWLPVLWLVGRLPGALARVLLALASLVGVFGYATSWASFRSTGRFLDPEGVRFVFDVNPLQFFQHVAHMEPWVLMGLPLIVLATTPALLRFGPTLTAGLGGGRQRRLQRVGFGLIALCAAGALFGPRVAADEYEGVLDPDAGLVYTMAELFDLSRDERTGPALHLASLVRDRVWREEIDRPVAPDLVPSRDPIESIDEYLAGVDRDGLARPNVVIVLIESLRADQLRAGGSRRTVMPTVESIAASGRFYSRHWAQASHSNYADLAPLSSQYPLRGERTHVYPRDPPYPRVLIYDVLKGLGYATAIVSSQNETWGGMLNFLDTGNLDAVLHSENFDGPTYVPRHDKGFESYVQGTKRSGKIDDRFTVDRAIKWIDGVGDKPFFLYLNLQSSHLPYETPADFPRRFGPEEIDFTIRFNNFPRDKADVVKDVYANALAYVDFQLGRLVGHLKRTGRWDDTLVVVSGDTGQAFYEHGFSGHANQLYDELVRVPLVIRAPGLSPGVDPHPAQQVDVPPTLLDLLGLPPHPGFQGHSLVAPDAEPDPPLFLVAQAPLAHEYALVRWPYKYVWDVRRQYGVLFDLARDPGETEDRSVRQAEVAARMGAELETWRRAQIDYYRDPALYSRWYPPRLLRVN